MGNVHLRTSGYRKPSVDMCFTECGQSECVLVCFNASDRDVHDVETLTRKYKCFTMERTDRMDSVVFDRHHLDTFLSGTTSLYKIFLSVLEDDSLSKPYAQSKLLEKINQSIQNYWEPIEALFVRDPYTGYESGQFTDQENIHPSKVFIDICQGLNLFVKEVRTKMDKSYSNEVDFRTEIRALKEELLATKQELRQVNTEHMSCKMEIGSSKGTIAHLEKLNREKSDRIAELQRADTVQLWEKEKVRLLQNNSDRMKELEKQVEELKSDKVSLQHKVQHFETKVGVEKLKKQIQEEKQSVPIAETGKTVNAEAGQPVQQGILELRQHIYVLEKDLRKLDSELHSQQKTVIGIMGGLRTDYDTTFKRLIDHGDDEVVGLEVNTILRAQGLRKVLYKLYDLAQHGKLNQAIADLPEYYIALDRDVRKGLVRKISNTYHPTGLTPLPNKSNSSVGPDTITEDIKPVVPKITVPDNPKIVNEKTGIVNHIMVLKHFPHFTRDYVQEQYGHFKSFDTNGDHSLDISEVMSAMTKTLGQQFKAGQIKEAMSEVDVDGDDTLDFYEYLKVADMLSHKNGRSEVFKSNLVMQQGRNMSKTCIVM